MTAKISGNALKQGEEHTQKHNAARIPRRIAVDQKVCCWDGGHPGLAVWNFLNYTRIENAHKLRKKTFDFYYVADIRTDTKRRKDTTGLAQKKQTGN